MFKIEEKDNRFPYKFRTNAVIWNKADKTMVKSVIIDSFMKMKISKGDEATLTRINWSKAYVDKDKLGADILKISINIAWSRQFNFQFCNWSSMWESQRIYLEIPFAAFRDYKLNNILA